MNRPRVAFVVQRCGDEVNGGAEFLCLSVARQMARIWDVTIVTTTARDYVEWAPYYRAGTSDLDGVRVVRFDVDAVRNVTHFDKLCVEMLRNLSDASDADQEAWMRAQGPYSTDLLRYIEDNRASYDLWFFYTYLYAPTYFGLPLAGNRSVLVPFAHDEWPIWMPSWDRIFGSARRIVFSTHEERDFLHRRFPRLQLNGPTVGIGVQPPSSVKAQRFRERFGITGPFGLYVGRVDPNKGCAALIEDWEVVHRENPDLTLVLLGRAAMNVPNLPYIRALGFVEEESKFDALAAAEFLVMPSTHESLSIVLLESWSVGTPVLVNGASDVLVGQCRRARGGLWYGDAAELAAATNVLREQRTLLGESGRQFVASDYTWQQIRAKYESLFSELSLEAAGQSR